MSPAALETDLLREVVARELFVWGGIGVEGFALRHEFLPAVPSAPRSGVSPFARASAVPPNPPTPESLVAVLTEVCTALALPFEPQALWMGSAETGARIDLGPGGQVRVHSPWCASPGAAERAAADAVDRLRAALIERGLVLLALGAEPWHGEAAGAGADATPWGQCQELVYASAGPLGPFALRASASNGTRVAFGGPQRGAARWRAAWLLAPLFEALFAHSPLERGASARQKSVRANAWRHAEPTRTGFPRDVIETPSMSPVDQYLEFALSARALWVLGEGEVFPLERALTFGEWNCAGFEGRFPSLDDWRCHLATLQPLVRPAGALSLECADAQGRAFAGVPLALASLLLCDDRALQEVIGRLGCQRVHARGRLEAAAREALLDPVLVEDARALFDLANEALERVPEGWISDEQARALAVFGRRFVHRGRAPADEVLDLFLENGSLSLAQLEALEDEWCAAVGVPVTWRGARRSA
ncbi:MAG TPA: glutamate-cysteine ligase family protein [Planctomycetota bacterium]|nr:glutamate-cysteine ligase family protein [Planctomycetota bacterium]